MLNIKHRDAIIMASRTLDVHVKETYAFDNVEASTELNLSDLNIDGVVGFMSFRATGGTKQKARENLAELLRKTERKIKEKLCIEYVRED